MIGILSLMMTLIKMRYSSDLLNCDRISIA